MRCVAQYDSYKMSWHKHGHFECLRSVLIYVNSGGKYIKAIILKSTEKKLMSVAIVLCFHILIRSMLEEVSQRFPLRRKLGFWWYYHGNFSFVFQIYIIKKFL